VWITDAQSLNVSSCGRLCELIPREFLSVFRFWENAFFVREKKTRSSIFFFSKKDFFFFVMVISAESTFGSG